MSLTAKQRKELEEQSKAIRESKFKRLDELETQEASAAAVKIRDRIVGTISEDGDRIKLIPIDEIDPAPDNWNDAYTPITEDEELFEEMKESIRKGSLYNPIIIWEQENQERYYVLAGHSRLEVYRYYKSEGVLEFSEIPAIVKPYKSLTIPQAIRILKDTNEVARKKQAKPSQKILREHLEIIAVQEEAEIKKIKDPNYIGVSTAEIIGEMIGKSDRHVKDVMKLSKMPRHILKLIDETALTRQHLLNANEEVLNCFYEKRDLLLKDRVGFIKKGMDVDTVAKILDIGQYREPDVIEITVDHGKGEEIINILQTLAETENIKLSKVRLKRKKQTTK